MELRNVLLVIIALPVGILFLTGYTSILAGSFIWHSFACASFVKFGKTRRFRLIYAAISTVVIVLAMISIFTCIFIGSMIPFDTQPTLATLFATAGYLGLGASLMAGMTLFTFMLVQMGVAASTFILHMFRSQTHKGYFVFGTIQKTLSPIALILSCIIVGLSALYGLRDPRIVEYEVWPPASTSNSVTVAHLTDLHFGAVRNRAWVETIVRKVNEANPDYVFITGDTIDNDVTAFKEIVPTLSDLTAIASSKVYAISGNHDSSDLDEWEAELTAVGVQCLRNTAKVVGPLSLIGVDSLSSHSTDSPPGNMTEALTQFAALPNVADRPGVLLMHQPDDDEMAKADMNPYVNLILAGHTHGGQMWPITAIVAMQFDRIVGAYDLMFGTKLIIGQGTGTWGPPMRLGTNNEIGIVTIHY